MEGAYVLMASVALLALVRCLDASPLGPEIGIFFLLCCRITLVEEQDEDTGKASFLPRKTLFSELKPTTNDFSCPFLLGGGLCIKSPFHKAPAEPMRH